MLIHSCTSPVEYTLCIAFDKIIGNSFSDVNKDWTLKDEDKDKDLTLKDKDKDKDLPRVA